jgi:hypothetical protein
VKRAAWLEAAIVMILVCRAAHAANAPDPARALFAQGRYAAAAVLFQERWSESKRPVDGMNAVVAWRTAGRYAEARALLAEVEAGGLPSEMHDGIAQLHEKLGKLTGTITLAGNAGADAIIKVDRAAPQRLRGGDLVVDVGPREITITEEHCERFTWRGVVLPGAHVVVDATLRCDRRGRLHVELDGATSASLSIDGAPAPGLDAMLPPGTHAIALARSGRHIADRVISVRTAETTSPRVRVPWRAQDGRFALIAGTIGSLTPSSTFADALGVGFGRVARRWRAFVELGSGADTHNAQLQGDAIAVVGHPWMAFSGAIHVLPAVWQGRVAGARVSLDFDPLAARVDVWDADTPLGLFAHNYDTTLVRVSAFPITLSVDAGALHLEAVLWPVAWSSLTGPISLENPFISIDQHGAGGVALAVFAGVAL